MANLLEDWLNKEVKLSRNIINIDEDFSNGFLFGELLHKYNLIKNFYSYKDNNNQETKLTNLKLLETTLRELNIKIERGRISDILNKKRGVASRFLYLIKMNLSKRQINFENLILKKCKIFI